MHIYPIGLDGYRILQLSNASSSQMMGYLVYCPNGKLIVIDGGTAEAGPRLRQLLREAGGRVSLWLLTHFHHDHVTAPLDILERPDGITVDRICGQAVSPALRQPGFGDSDPLAARFEALAVPDRVLADAGVRLEAGGVTVDCLNDPMRIVREPWLDAQNFHINDSSAVYRLTFPNGKTALFPGDLGPGLSDRLAGELGDRLRADICQMSHHGQNGASRRFYACVRPSFCFWDAPDWLWENDAGGGFGTGPWATLEVRRWMAELGVIRHAHQGLGENLLV